MLFDRIAQRYQNSVAVVIGAGGIGREIARYLVTVSARLIIADRDQATLDALVTQLASDNMITRTIDVCDADSVTEFFREISQTAGVPDFVFYTAGILNIESLAETTSDSWKRAVDVNLSGAFHCIKAATDLMRTQHRGSIVALGSIAGTKARSGSRVNPVYNSTKAALAAMVNATAMQLRSEGVRINCVSPGPTDTSMMGLQPPQVLNAVSQITLDGRMNSPSEVAETALFVAAHGRFTGEEIPMGGGAGLGG